jgi:ATP-dependent exoDNAse (exonuclease V) alpha subunit
MENKEGPMKDNQTATHGTIKSIQFRNSDGWAVFTMDNGTKCTGTLAEMIDVGTAVTCLGMWVMNDKFGKQIKCDKIVPEPIKADSTEGVTKLLQRLPGIGPKKAMEAVHKMGPEKAWQLAKEDPEQLGVKTELAETAKRIAISLVDNIEATIYLLGIGLTDNKANTVIAHFGDKHAVAVVSENPYRLMDIEGFGFITADKIAFQAGMEAGNQARVSACIIYCLNDSQKNEGHIYFYGKVLIAVVIDMMTESAKKAEVPIYNMPGYDQVREAIYNLQAEGKVFIEDGRVFSKELLEAEQTIERFLK